MKKVLQLALALLLWQAAATAQIFYDFEDGQMPAGFTLINGDMLTPALESDAVFADSAWIVTSSSAFPGFAALSISWYEDAQGNEVGPCDDWLILPKIMLGNDAVLNFKARSATSSGNFRDDYMVLINPDEPTIESFEEEGTILWQEEGVIHTAFQERSINLDQYAGQTVYLAFRNITNTNGYGLWIDDIEVVNGSLPTGTLRVDPAAFGLALAPNPAAGSTNLAYTLTEAARVELSVSDLLGRTWLNLPQGWQGAGQYNLPLDLQKLAAGAYVVQIRTEQQIASTRLIVR
jgi:hypothetical protein